MNVFTIIIIYCACILPITILVVNPGKDGPFKFKRRIFLLGIIPFIALFGSVKYEIYFSYWLGIAEAYIMAYCMCIGFDKTKMESAKCAIPLSIIFVMLRWGYSLLCC